MKSNQNRNVARHTFAHRRPAWHGNHHPTVDSGRQSDYEWRAGSPFEVRLAGNFQAKERPPA